MAEGIDPTEEKRKSAAEKITVKQAFDKFFAARTELAKATVDNYSRTGYIYLKSWAKKPMAEITRQMVLKNIRICRRRMGRAPPTVRFATSAQFTTS